MPHGRGLGGARQTRDLAFCMDGRRVFLCVGDYVFPMRDFLPFIPAMIILAACAVKENPAHTKIYTPAGTVDYHCPPGQAKQGKC